MKEKHFDLLMDVIDRRIVPPFSRLGNRPWFYAMRAALQQIAPVAIAGSIPVLVSMCIKKIWGASDPAIENLLKSLFETVFGLVGILFIVCMSLEMTERLKNVKRSHCLVVSILAFLLVISGKTGISAMAHRLGPQSILISILTTVTSLQLLQTFARIGVADKIGKHVPMGVASEIADVFSVLTVVILFWIVIRCLPLELYDVLFKATQFLVNVFDTWYCLLILILLLQTLWFAGMHGGSAVVWGIMSPFMLIILYQNATQFFSGGVPTGIVTQPMLFTFAMPTGVGLTLPLAIAWRRSKVSSLREMSKISIKPGIFEINETVIFGTPISRNRYFFVPFVFITPVVGSLFGFFLTRAGLVSAAAVQVPWATPLLLQPLLATGLDWRAAAAQIVLMVLVYLIWLPYAKRWEKHLIAEQGKENRD